MLLKSMWNLRIAHWVTINRPIAATAFSKDHRELLGFTKVLGVHIAYRAERIMFLESKCYSNCSPYRT